MAVAVFAYLISQTNLQKMVQYARSADLIWVAGAFAIVLSIYFGRAVSFCVLCAARASLPVVRLFKINLVSAFFSTFLPTQVGGDVVKGVYLVPYFQGVDQTYASLVVHRVIGGIGTLLVSGVALAFWRLPHPQALQLIAVACIALGIITYMSVSAVTPIERQLVRLSSASNRVVRWSAKLLYSVSQFRHERARLLVALGMSMIDTLQGVLVYAMLAIAVQCPMTVLDLVLAGSISQLSVLLALTPAGIGVTEGAFVAMCMVLGVSKEPAIVISLLMRLQLTAAALIGGCVYMSMPLGPRSKRESLDSVQAEHY
ncbi:MAG: lysylphosphatidylglycerol synthase transmembrane domain-containing protein [Candidatus Sumerlaeaceae bacterium]